MVGGIDYRLSIIDGDGDGGGGGRCTSLPSSLAYFLWCTMKIYDLAGNLISRQLSESDDFWREIPIQPQLTTMDMNLHGP